MGKVRSNRKEIEGDVRRAFSRSMEDTAGEADENAPVREGSLHASITWHSISDRFTALRAKVGSALRYARIRELGGTILPIRAKRLVWRGLDGRWHSAKRVVQAPGGRKGSSKYGKPYIAPAVKHFGDHMKKHLRAAR